MKQNQLYIIENIINKEEYKKMVQYFPLIYWKYVFSGSKLNLIFLIIITLLSHSFIISFIFFIISELFLLIYYKIELGFIAERDYKFWKKKNKIKEDIEKSVIEFYEEFFIEIRGNEKIAINYLDVERAIETDTNFYFLNRGKIIIMQKSSVVLNYKNISKKICLLKKISSKGRFS